MKKVSHVFLDFGGCIDAPGIHSRTLFWEAFLLLNLAKIEERNFFQENYTFADQRMMKTGEAKDLSLAQFNRLNARLVGGPLKVSAEKCDEAGDLVTQKMDGYLKDSRKELLELSKSIPLSIISNFTGNLEIILKEYHLHHIFASITESYYVGASKPNPAIFLAAQEKIGISSKECLYVGDNPVNDVSPAKALGWSALLIGEKRECEADGFIQSLSEIKNFL
jgi:HAD superfamily hydrolase (TIGR01549 family)